MLDVAEPFPPSPAMAPAHTAACMAPTWPLLAAAGPLLWRHRGPRPLPPLHAPAIARERIDSDGVLEWLEFDDGHVAWLLPDSDYLGWERLQHRIAARRAGIDVFGGCVALVARRAQARRLGWRHGVFVADPGGAVRAVRRVSILAQELIGRVLRDAAP
jgi:hypothetical protein